MSVANLCSNFVYRISSCFVKTANFKSGQITNEKWENRLVGTNHKKICFDVNIANA